MFDLHPYFTSEVNSSDIPSDNPIFQRTKKAYEIVAENSLGSVLEIGCGEGYGIPILMQSASSYLGVDKNRYLIRKLSSLKHNAVSFHHQHVPPLSFLESNSVDTVVCFQVIEHVSEAEELVKEIRRVLVSGGKLYMSTPNASLSVSRNPWHVKEYSPSEFGSLFKEYSDLQLAGVVPNELAETYYEKSNESTKSIVKMDVLKFSKWLPSPLLYLPYEILNRMHRNQLQRRYPDLVQRILSKDYSLSNELDRALDLFAIATK